MKGSLLFAVVFCCSAGLLVYYSRLPLIEYEVVTNASVQQLDKDGFPTGEGYTKAPVVKTYKNHHAAAGGAIGFGLIAAASWVGFALTLRGKDKG